MIKQLRWLCAAALFALASLPAPAATILPPSETCFQAVTGINGMVGALGSITPGSGGTTGSYGGIPLTGGSGTGATANVTVSAGGVASLAILNPGQNYVVSDVLSAASANIGNVTGFSVPVNSISINSSLAGGTATFYVPGTQTFKQTWQNSGQTILNTNPVNLDQNGCALIYGEGVYRSILKDSLGNTIFDQLTASTDQGGFFFAGLAGGLPNAITVSDSNFSETNGQGIQFYALGTNTGAATLTVSPFGALAIVKDTTTGPTALTGGEIVAGNLISVVYDSVNSEFHLVSFPTSTTVSTVTPQGRLTLVSGQPVMSGSTAAATAIIYTPSDAGAQVPVWNGTAFVTTNFTETSQALSDTTLSPAAAIANSAYDEFEWKVPFSGAIVVTRGPAWQTTTTRGYTLVRVNGLLTNPTNITNGPAAGFGVYVGSILTDAGGATVTWTPNSTTGQSASSGAFLDVWNMYNRIDVKASVIDTGTGYAYGTATIRQARASTGNQITVFSGLPEDGLFASYLFEVVTNSTAGNWVEGIGLDSTTTANVASWLQTNETGSQDFAGSPSNNILPQTGLHVISANEESASSLSMQFNSAAANQLNLAFRM